MNSVDIFRLTDEELWRGLKELASRERHLAADVVAYVAEIERRMLAIKHGWTSMFDYCVQSLRWSEATAFRRTRAARVVRRYPLTLEMLYDGRLHVEGLVILYAFLEEKDFPSLLLKAVGKTTRSIEELVADRRTAPPKRDSIRCVGVAPLAPAPATPQPSLALPAAPGAELDAAAYTGGPYRVAGQPNDSRVPPKDSPILPNDSPAQSLDAPAPVEVSAAAAAPPPAPVVRVFRVGVTVDEELRLMILRARQLMRHKYPDGSLEGIFRDALRLLIEKIDLGVRAELAAKRRAARARRASG